MWNKLDFYHENQYLLIRKGECGVMNENHVKIFSTMNPVEAHMVKFLMVNNGIEAIVDNDELNSFFGIVAARDALTDVWVPAVKSAIAVELMRERSAIDLKNLTISPCPACGAANCGLFDYCWNCQADLESGARGETVSGDNNQPAERSPWASRRSPYVLLAILAAIIGVFLIFVFR